MVVEFAVVLTMLPKVGDTLYYIPEVFAIESEIQAGFGRLDCTRTKIRYVAAAKILGPLSSVKKVDVGETGLSALQIQNVFKMIERNSLFFFQLEALK